MPVERDLVAHFGLLVVDPSIRRVRKDLSFELRVHVLT
jgi:hypothetical protein